MTDDSYDSVAVCGEGRSDLDEVIDAAFLVCGGWIVNFKELAVYADCESVDTHGALTRWVRQAFLEVGFNEPFTGLREEVRMLCLG